MAAHASATAAIIITGSNNPENTATVTIAAINDTIDETRSATTSIELRIARVPWLPPCRTNSRKPASSNATASTPSTASYTSSLAAHSTFGDSTPCTSATAASSNARAAYAETTSAMAGRDATTRSGVGPCSSRALSTFAVASSPNAVTQPDTTCSAPATSVHRGEARHASPSTAATAAGTARTVFHQLAATTFWSAVAHFGAATPAMPMNCLSPSITPSIAQPTDSAYSFGASRPALHHPELRDVG